MDKKELKKQEMIVIDFGGGTFDVTVLTLDKGVAKVRATNGDMHLGGQDLDNCIVDDCIEEFKRTENVDITGDKKALWRLKEAVGKAKTVISIARETDIHIDMLKNTDFDYVLRRFDFERLCEPVINKIIPLIEKALADAKLRKEDLHKVILAGGSTRVPKVQEILKEFFGMPLDLTLNPDECVAKGAAIIAAKRQAIKVTEVVPQSLGVLLGGGKLSVLIPKNKEIPCEGVKDFANDASDKAIIAIQVYQGDNPDGSDG